MKIRNYVRAESLQQAYELNQKRSARILGGMLWLRQGKETIQTAIDLSGLGLDQIQETEEEFQIGCMATLRQLEQHPGLNAYTNGAIRDALRDIVGVQFRNLATVGGSIWGRFGFSDVLTVFLALDTWVELYPGGQMSLKEFAEKKKDNEILVKLIVKKRSCKTAYQAFRNTRTDFPALTCAVSLGEEGTGTAVIGARPGRAVCLELSQELCRALQGQHPDTDSEGANAETAEACGETGEGLQESAFGRESRKKLAETSAAELAAQVPMGSNLRAGAEYRSHLAQVLLKRNFLRLMAEAEEKSGEGTEDRTDSEKGGAAR